MRRFFFNIFLMFAFISGAFVLTGKSPVQAQDTRTSLQQQAGQMIICGFRGLRLTQDDPLRQAIARGLCGGVILFDRDVLEKSNRRNIQSKDQVRSLTRELQALSPVPLLIAVDQEGGRVARLKSSHGFPAFPSAAALGAQKDLKATFKQAALMGRSLADVGITCNLAPVVDVNTNPDNPAIGRLDRSFSADHRQVGIQAAAFIRGLHQANILTCIKHFPGHGSAFNDSHLGMTDITQTWSRQELLPYRHLIRSGLCDMVMTGHLVHRQVDPHHPASLSRAWTQGVLRREMGFSKVVITDDLQMKAVTDHYTLRQTIALAIQAGADILLFGNNLRFDPHMASKATSIITDLVQQGRISKDRIHASYTRIMQLKKNHS